VRGGLRGLGGPAGITRRGASWFPRDGSVLFAGRVFSAGVFPDSYRACGATIVADDRVAELRRLASQCLRVSYGMSTEEGRLALIEMARVWSRLADEQEAAALPPAAMPKGSRPVMQQQEQVPPKKDNKE
jgi:hypothetical protein